MFQGVITSVASTIGAIVTQSAVDAVRRLAYQIISVIVALGVGLTGLGFLCGASYLALAQDHGKPIAAAVVAGGLLVLCVASLLIGSYLAQRAQRPSGAMKQAVKKAGEAAQDAGLPGTREAILAELVDRLGRPERGTAKGDLALLAAVSALGFAVGVSPQLRRSLLLGVTAMLSAWSREK